MSTAVLLGPTPTVAHQCSDDNAGVDVEIDDFYGVLTPAEKDEGIRQQAVSSNAKGVMLTFDRENALMTELSARGVDGSPALARVPVHRNATRGRGSASQMILFGTFHTHTCDHNRYILKHDHA